MIRSLLRHFSTINYLYFLLPFCLIAGCPAEKRGEVQTIRVVAKAPVEIPPAQAVILPTTKNEPPIQDVVPLTSFYTKLAALRNTHQHAPIHILQIGDSHVASDTMSAELRRSFQADFGDGGRGYIAAGLPWRGYRQENVGYGMSSDWWTETGRRNDDNHIFGIGGTRIISEKKGASFDRTESSPFNQFSISYLKTRETGAFALYLNDSETPFQIIDTKLNEEDIQTLYQKDDPATRKQYQARSLTIENDQNLGTSLEVSDEDILVLELTPEAKSDLEKRREAHHQRASKSRKKTIAPFLDESVYRLGVQTFSDLPEDTRTLKIVALDDRPVIFFGTMVRRIATSPDAPPGVIVSSIGLNGARAATFTQLSSRVAQQELVEMLRPDLVVVTLGTNEAYNLRNETAFSPELVERERVTYRRFIDSLISGHEISLIAMSPMEFALKPDSSSCYKRRRVRRGRRRRWVRYLRTDIDLEKHPECRWTSPPSLALMRNLISDAATETESAHWDAYVAMGGEGSIQRWARQDPPLAGSDGVHLVLRGYQELGRRFYGDFMEAYRRWVSGGTGYLATSAPIEMSLDDESELEVSQALLSTKGESDPPDLIVEEEHDVETPEHHTRISTLPLPNHP